MAVLNHSSSLLMKMQVLNCCLKQGWLVPSLHPKLSMKLPNFPVTLHACILQAHASRYCRHRGWHKQKAGEALSSKVCISVFRRGKMRAQPGSAEDAIGGVGCSQPLLCCACRGIWGNEFHTEAEKCPGSTDPSEVRSLGTSGHLNISWEQQFLSGLRHPGQMKGYLGGLHPLLGMLRCSI